MKNAIRKTAAPLHIVVVHDREREDVRTTLACIRDRAGYPHTVSVVDLSGDVSSRAYLNTLHQTGLIHNLVTVLTPQAPAVPVMQTLAMVEAPYVLVLHSGTNFTDAGWLADMLGNMVAAKAPAFACANEEQQEAGTLRHCVRRERIVNPNTLSALLCDSGHTVLATRAALERMDIFTHRGLTFPPADAPHSADIAARETRRHAVQNLQ
ncbi:hypothetical protein N1030_09815 [Desulfovibrio mangrovi]|uniref:hypothetical protein n=1 Tax=Desulfovibrio mangrovi TaxID=2976983 RepID=UPI0022466B23|nr:hypothetical protein [Desulfovibrio mangrovi]UZP65921.1 hypothetical protein N1030_09815 [Desulfovibrio mangrovi]